jgi:hypothetical protein
MSLSWFIGLFVNNFRYFDVRESKNQPLADSHPFVPRYVEIPNPIDLASHLS